MEIRSDFSELLALFNEYSVEYIIVGGIALAWHGAPRYTGDIDILVHAEDNNAQRIVAALEAFGFGGMGIGVEDFTAPERVLQLGYPPVRIDLMTTLTGVSWSDAWRGCVGGVYGGISVHFLGRAELISNKRACGRTRDLADIEALEKVPGEN